ncbi:uncharacterized protein [Parasteatoda tepidariorum]|uniref:uncharacterized protein n=1 Tax=Parasteatoda tepidariorum TaxID=114398 RepID=UPI0039BC7E9F
MNVLKEIREQKATYPEYVVQKLMKSFYVDNCVTSVKDIEELNMFQRVATEIMASRKFDLRGWEYTDLTEENSQPSSNVLGMSWDKKYDTLPVSTGCIKELNIEKVTKRTILSAVHRLFDPLGMICLVTMIPKLLLQSIWKLKLNWDDDVDENIRREFLKWIEGVLHIEKINIPRYFGLSGSKKCSIYLPQELWTSSKYVVNEEEVNWEKRKGVTTSMINFEVTKLLSSNISDNRKIVHTMAWVTRFRFNCKNEERRKGDLSVNELEEAEKTTVYLIQQESFTRVSDKSLKTLDIIIDKKGIYRLRTTVYKRDDFEEFRTPAVLPGEHPIVLSEHRKRGHAGVSCTLNSLRERFWLLCGRRTVKAVSRSCVVCKRFSAKSEDPSNASPPGERVQDTVFPVTGVDFAGL